MSIGIWSMTYNKQVLRARRSVRSDKLCLSISSVVFVLFVVLIVTVLAYFYISGLSNRTDDHNKASLLGSFSLHNIDGFEIIVKSLKNYVCAGVEVNSHPAVDDDLKNDFDFLTNVTRTSTFKVLGFGKGLTAHGRDSRYWDKDDRRRDDDYNEDVVEHTSMDARDESASMSHVSVKLDNRNKKISGDDPHKSLERKGIGLYNEASHHELKWYEAEYKGSLKSMGQSGNDTGNKDQQPNDKESIDVDDEYDDNIEFHGTKYEEYDDSENDKMDHSDLAKIQNQFHRESSDLHDARKQDQNIATKVGGAFGNLSVDSSLKSQNSGNDANYKHVSLGGGQSTKASQSESKRKGKRRIFGFCLVAKEKDGLVFSRQYFFCSNSVTLKNLCK